MDAGGQLEPKIRRFISRRKI